MEPIAEPAPAASPEAAARAAGAAAPPAPDEGIESLPMRSAGDGSLALAAATRAPGGEDAAATDKVAVFVCHGMGQQVPFETLDTVATTLARHVGLGGGTVSPIEVGLATFAGRDRPLPRAAMTIGFDAAPPAEVHIFESYWAPITEGNVTLRDVMRFLWNAGSTGFTKLFSPFRRWAFGGFQNYGCSIRAPLFLLLALLVVAALVAVNTVIVLVTTARFLSPTSTAWPRPALVADLTVAILELLAAFAAVGAVFWMAHQRHKRHAEALGQDLQKSWLRLWVALTVVAVWWAVGAVLVAAGSLAAQLWWHGAGPSARVVSPPQVDPVLTAAASWWSEPAAWRALLDAGWQARLAEWLVLGDGRSLQAFVIAVVWLLAFFASAKVRGLLVQYVGDVVAYVSAHEASRFCRIRAAIQQEALDVARTVYAARRADGAPL